MFSTWRTSGIVAVFLLMVTGCDSAAKQLKQGDALAKEGKFEEAINIYEAIATNFPDDPDREKVRKAVQAALFGKAQAASGDLSQVIAVHGELVENHRKSETELPNPDPIDALLMDLAAAKYAEHDFAAVAAVQDTLNAGHGTAAAGMLKGKSKGLVWAVKFVEADTNGGTSAAAVMNDVRGSIDVSSELREAAAGWLCERKDLLPGISECGSVDPDVAGIAMTDAKERLHTVEDACKMVATYKGACGDEWDATVDGMLEAEGLVALRANVATAIATWERKVDAEANAAKSKAASWARSCVSYEGQSRRIQGQMLDAVTRNRFAAAMALESKETALRKKINAKKEELDDLKEEVEESDWPAQVKAEVEKAIGKARDDC